MANADGKKILERKTFHILYTHTYITYTYTYTYHKNEVSNSLDGFYVLNDERRCNQLELVRKLLSISLGPHRTLKNANITFLSI